MDGRVITRRDGGVNDVEVLFVEEIGVFEPEKNGLGLFGGCLRVFAGSEHEKETDDAHVLDAAPLGDAVAGRRGHVVEFGDDGGVDRPDARGLEEDLFG